MLSLSPSLAPLTATAPLRPPIAKAVYPNPAAVKSALQEHARANGYRIAVDSSTTLQAFYRCFKGKKYDNRFKDPTMHESRQRKDTSTIKTNCKYRVVARKEKGLEGDNR